MQVVMVVVLGILGLAGSASAATLFCEGHASFTKFHTNGEAMNDRYIKLESPTRSLETMRLSLVGRLSEPEIFSGQCSGGLSEADPIRCSLSSWKETIILELEGRRRDVRGWIELENGVRTQLSCVN